MAAEAERAGLAVKVRQLEEAQQRATAAKAEVEREAALVRAEAEAARRDLEATKRAAAQLAANTVSALNGVLDGDALVSASTTLAAPSGDLAAADISIRSKVDQVRSLLVSARGDAAFERTLRETGGGEGGSGGEGRRSDGGLTRSMLEPEADGGALAAMARELGRKENEIASLRESLAAGNGDGDGDDDVDGDDDGGDQAAVLLVKDRQLATENAVLRGTVESLQAALESVSARAALAESTAAGTDRERRRVDRALAARDVQVRVAVWCRVGVFVRAAGIHLVIGARLPLRCSPLLLVPDPVVTRPR